MLENDALVRSVTLTAPPDGETRTGYPWRLPVVGALAAGIELHPKVTYLIGANGSGKSTLLEAIAVAAGMRPEGGSSNFAFKGDPDTFALSARDARGELSDAVRLVRGVRRPRTDFYLRAESLFPVASYLEQLTSDSNQDPLRAYGGVSLHEQSHGEGFLAILINRLGPDGFYLFDEPEAALSTQNCLTCVRRIHELVCEGSQFVIATHSPLILAYPHSTIYACTNEGMEVVAWEDTDPVRLTKAFLDAPDRFLRELLKD